MPEGLDKESVSDKISQVKNNGKLAFDKNRSMCGCDNTFNIMERCVVAGCDSCVKNVENNNHQPAKIYKCRGRRISMPTKELSDKIEEDWSLNRGGSHIILMMLISKIQSLHSRCLVLCAANSFQRISRT